MRGPTSAERQLDLLTEESRWSEQPGVGQAKGRRDIAPTPDTADGHARRGLYCRVADGGKNPTSAGRMLRRPGRIGAPRWCPGDDGVGEWKSRSVTDFGRGTGRKVNDQSQQDKGQPQGAPSLRNCQLKQPGHRPTTYDSIRMSENTPRSAVALISIKHRNSRVRAEAAVRVPQADFDEGQPGFVSL